MVVCESMVSFWITFNSYCTVIGSCQTCLAFTQRICQIKWHFSETKRGNSTTNTAIIFVKFHWNCCFKISSLSGELNKTRFIFYQMFFELFLKFSWTVGWTRFWNFIGRQVKFNAFLHPNDHPERICLYLVRQFEGELAKIGHIFTK